jgi:hypothetical protein
LRAPRGSGPNGWRRARRIAPAASILCLLPAIVFYAEMLAQRSDSSVGIRTVEWLRDNGARGLVTEVENVYNSLIAPSAGGPALRSLPRQPGTVPALNAAKDHAVPYYRPPRIRPIIRPALPGEGVWRATFAAGGPDVGPAVLYARQNLPLIVDHGRTNPNLSDGPQWGATLGDAIQVWRSAVGVDRHGNLIYAAANYQTVGSLAAIMIHAGAVRAMELDINTYWTSFITYRHPGAGDPANLLPDMDRSPERYLTPDDRDFFAVNQR